MKSDEFDIYCQEEKPRPDVSVIIPTRNALAWLPAALESIGQNPNLEIIIVNDGSTDGTNEFLQMKKSLDKRIKVIKGPCLGPSAARNVAIDVAKAPLIAFLDADDRWRPGKIEAQTIFHQKNPHIGLSFTDYMHHTMEGVDKGGCFVFWPRFNQVRMNQNQPFIIEKNKALGLIYSENIVGTSTVMVRTDLLKEVGGFETSLRSAEDWDLWMRLARKADVGCIPWIAGDYLMHRPGNVSNDTSRRARAMRYFADRHLGYVMTIDKEAVFYCEARIKTAEAESATATKKHGKAFFLRLQAVNLRPTKRYIKEMLSEIIQIIGYKRKYYISST